jgi:Bifunctional DNA primase/polymerase, N-terminal
MLNIVDIGPSVTSEAINQSSLGDILTAAAPAANPAHAGKAPPLDAAGRGFSPTDEYAVIDVDARNGGGATLKLLIEGFPKTAATQPKRGHGRLFYALPPGVAVQSGGVALGPGLTLQSSRGSSICARSYRWANDKPVAAAPQWLLARIGTTPQSPQHMTDTTAPTAHAAATARQS